MSNRPDLSNFLAHFTRDGSPSGGNDASNPASSFSSKSAMEKLIGILESGEIVAGNIPWVGRKAVCFTECPWSSLLEHANHYAPYAVGFAKPRVFAAGGGPAYYVRADHWDKQDWDPHLKAFATPFWPDYRPARLKGDEYLNGKTIDYSHEREWRVPHNFKFELDKVEFVILPTYEAMAQFLKELKDGIGREKFLLMEVYKTIENLWPVHNI